VKRKQITGASHSAFVRCDYWGNYKAPVTVDEAYDEALYEFVNNGDKVHKTQNTDGSITFYRRKRSPGPKPRG